MFGADVSFNDGGVFRKIPSTWQKFEDAGGRSLLRIARSIIREAQKLVPYQSGFLHDSGYAVQIPTAAGGTRISLGFTAPYALWIHENMDLYHPNGQAKFLEIPFRLAANTIKATLAGDIRAETGGR